MNKTIMQHYVPRFLLKNFKIPIKKGEEAVLVFDKSNFNEFQSAINKIAAENYFYEVKTQNGKYSIEADLGKYETDAGAIVNRIIKYKSLKSMTKKDKIALSKFIAIQILRVPSARNQVNDVFDFIFKFTGEVNCSEQKKLYSKVSHCESILSSANKLSPFLYNKDWVLYESKGENYIIGDNPVVLNNTFNNGELGLKSEGVEIYLPLSPNYCLLLICKSVRKTLSKKIAELSGDAEAKTLLNTITKFHDTLKSNGTSFSPTEVVTFVNSLQIQYAERFLYSHKKHSDLPKEMLSSM